MAYGKIKADTLIYDNSGSDTEVTISSLGNKAPLASPTFTGTVTIPTASANDNTTKAASTAYVQTELGDYATTASPTFTGTVTVPTPSAGDNSTKAASTAYVVNEFAPKAAPAFTGTATGVNLTLSGNLTVNGTTTTINSTTLTVDDKNIELGTVDTPSDTTADGGGITLKGATDKEIKWVDSTDNWTFNQNIEILKGEASNAELHFTADEGDDNADKWKMVAFDGSSSGTFNLYNYASGSWEKSIEANGNGNVELYYDDSKKLETTATGVTVTGTVSDSKGDVRKIPINFHNAGTYTLVAADAGKVVSEASMGANITVPASVFAGGDAVTIMNHTGNNITLTQGSGVTMYNAADASTGNRTLAGRGFATLFYREHNVVYISGAGLS